MSVARRSMGARIGFGFFQLRICSEREHTFLTAVFGNWYKTRRIAQTDHAQSRDETG